MGVEVRSLSDARQHAHELIDRLPEVQLAGLVQFLETIVDPVTASLRNAPLDDEPVSAEEAAALDSAHAAIQRGEGIPHEEILRQFCLCRAPLDDEPETADEKAAVAEAREWLQQNRGKGIPHHEAMRRLGLE